MKKISSIKELKKNARANLRSHIFLFIFVCAIASFIGAEFKGALYLTIANKEHSFESIMTSIVENGLETTKQNIDDYINEEKKNESSMIGKTNGVFASSFNAISSGSIYLVGFSAFKNMINSSTTLIVISIAVASIIYFIFWYYFVNVYQVVTRRIFLEGITYKKVPLDRLIFLKKSKKWNKVAKTMFFKSLLISLWNLTIIGGIIKRYSYLMVPYILAENPNIKARDAINLSRKMMDGHKCEAFLISLSFIGWNLLGVFSWGVTTVIFSNPYEIATFAEYFKKLRQISKEEKIENIELLNDKYLYEIPDEKIIKYEYKDVIEIMNKQDYVFEKKKGLKYVLHEFLGIHKYTEDEKKYEEQQLKEFIVQEFKPVIDRNTYPFRLFTLETKEKKYRIESLNYMRHYSLNSLIFIFFIISFAGWLWEVILYLVNEGFFANRGTLHGPWLPIYGGGSLLILLFLNKSRKNVPLQFILAMVLCGFVEYFTSWLLETMHGGTKWWDYSGYFINLHGRICAEGLIIFGLGGLAVVYYIAPSIDNALRRVKNKWLMFTIATILLSIYSFDMVYSSKNPNTGKGINDYDIAVVKDKNE